MAIGAYDPSAWAGLVLSDRPGRGFAVRAAVVRDGERAEGYDFMPLVHRVGPCAPDGRYARVSFDTRLPFGQGTDTPTVPKDGREPGLDLEWTARDPHCVVGRFRTDFTGTLELTCYFPWDWEGTWQARGHAVEARTADRGMSLCLVFEHRTLGGGDDGTLQAAGTDEVAATFVVDGGSSVYFAAFMHEWPETARAEALALLSADRIDRQLAEASASYEGRRVVVRGHWNGLAASITNNLHWMVSIKPESGRRYTPAGRRWIFPRHGGGRDHWTVFCWDAFFNAVELAVESPTLARETLLAVLETQYPNGNIPNWRGRFAGTPDRSQPPVGSFAVLKCYLRTGDRNLLEQAFPALQRWSEWWYAAKKSGRRRDGNGNGLFEWGCDLDLLSTSPAVWENEASHHQLAAWESGQDDLPNWDEARWVPDAETFDLESVDLNALLALDLECLAFMADELSLEAEAQRLRSRRAELVATINAELWDDELGMYVDRHWDGRRSRRLAASNFYPLVAGVPSHERASRLLETLRDERRFWGRYVLPSISRDDPAFAAQQYWRGTIWPPPNYLVYQGLRRYRFDEVAAELAARGVELFLTSWLDYQLCRENYDSRTGEGGGQLHQSWGPLFALAGIEEFIDVTPWDGLRIGTLTPPPESRIENVVVSGRTWGVRLSPNGLEVTVDGRARLRSTGPLVLRNLHLGDTSLRADTLTTRALSLSIDLGADTVTCCLDDHAFRAPAERVQVPAGAHTLAVSSAPGSLHH